MILPTNNNDLETYYTDQEVDDVAVSDDIRVAQTGSLEHMVHQFKDFVGARTSCEIELEARSTLAPSASTVFLQIFNQSTSSWETLDQDNTSRADVDFNFVKKISDLTSYKDSSSLVSVRVYQLAV